MFKFLAVPLALYAAYSLARGAIFGKSGIWGRTFRRDDEPWSYWSTVVVYFGLALAMAFVF
ncbi:MAG: hypothetical protein ABI612_00645 [Betaproteobacteria bacterium]